jgi:hypothetical protein
MQLRRFPHVEMYKKLYLSTRLSSVDIQDDTTFRIALMLSTCLEHECAVHGVKAEGKKQHAEQSASRCSVFNRRFPAWLICSVHARTLMLRALKTQKKKKKKVILLAEVFV